MSWTGEARNTPISNRRGRRLVVLLVVSLAIMVLLALAIVPYGASSQEIHLSPGSSATTSVSIPRAGWVTVHFEHPSSRGMPMRYWMQDSGGMMFDHSMMGGEDSYSFWSWGGTYQCGASSASATPGMAPVWVNTTWGML
jgi:hypothetical protein